MQIGCDDHSEAVTRREFLESARRTAALAAAGAVALDGSATSAVAALTPDEKPPLSDRKIRMGVVGGGFGASFHWHQDPNCIVKAVSDLRPDRRSGLMKVYRCERSYESLEKLILDKEIDAIAIFTPAPDHVRHAVLAMNAGKHVISAVPAAMTLEECRLLKETKEKTGRRYMMAETSWYRHHTIAARKLFEEGRFGDLFYSEVEYYHPMEAIERRGLWFHEGKRTWRFGYPPMLYPTHSTGFLVGVTRERLTQVSCLGYAPADEKEFRDNVYRNPFLANAALFRTDRGHMCRCNVSWVGTAHGERAQYFGTRLSFYFPGSGGQPFAMTGPGSPGWKEMPDFFGLLPEAMRKESGHGGSHPFLTHEFIAALCEDREPAIDVYESLAMTVPGIIAHESALKGGETLKVPSFERG